MNSFGKYIAVSLMLLFAFQLSAQSLGKSLRTKSSKAKKQYEKAIKSVEERNFQDAIVFLDAAISIDPEFFEAWAVRGDCYMFSGNCSKALESYYKALEIDPDYYPPLLYLTGLQEYQCEKYREAVDHFNAYIQHPKANPGKVRLVNDYLANANFALEMMSHPVKYNPVNMGPNINDTTDEYLPAITADESVLVYTVRRPRDRQTACRDCSTEEDFYCSEKDSANNWQPRYYLKGINSHNNEGAQCVSPDGKYLIFTICNREGGFGSCDLYWSKRIGDMWTTPRNLGRPVNSEAWESQPAFSSDGKTIYFVSNRYGSIGGSDIWKTTMLSEGEFSRPENLGNIINTQGEEVSPFIHPDNRTLYFASTGHPGFGGKDLFVSRLDSIGKWGTPKNLGYPINTPNDELNLVVNAAGDKGYLSSSKEGGYGGLDLYWFELDDQIKPDVVTYFKGFVYDETTKKPLEAEVELIDLATGTTVVKTISDVSTGNFLICLPTNHDYLLNVSHPDYLFYSDHIALKGIHDKTNPYIKDIPLKTFKIGETVVLKNVFFDTDKFILKEESKIELDRLVDLLKKNSRIKIEIGGHTDNQGSKEHNITLSQNRSNAVMQYLVNHGIDKTRLTCKGYGMSTPIATNENEAGRALNRRTEFKIIGF
jgi:outer membrane protein OmpA-like peptidoglycan-associated protein/tetratricopeptide (TPR) repeat protein